jgi:hypothetical protein
MITRNKMIRFSKVLVQIAAPVLVVGLCLTGCHASRRHHVTSQSSVGLKEQDLLAPADQKISEETIRGALTENQRIRLTRNEAILVAQSGNETPADPLYSELAKRLHLIPFTGVRTKLATESNEPAKVLRLAAARAGAKTVLVFWEVLETERKDLITQTVSWLPVLDLVVPDEIDHLRIHYKFGLMDVRTGVASSLASKTLQGTALNTAFRRAHHDSSNMDALKRKAAQEAVELLLKTYGEP